ncbi:MAG: autotransporter domain-containing protein [Spirochaetes bacterium]|nr:autotransporter domain-containing protein [Spirochaetota bacterium]
MFLLLYKCIRIHYLEIRFFRQSKWRIKESISINSDQNRRIFKFRNKFIKITILSVLLYSISSISLLAAKNTEKNTAKTLFIVFDVSSKNSPPNTGAKFSGNIRKIISDTNEFILVRDYAGLASLKKKYPKAIIIRGTITIEETKKDEKELTKYAVEDQIGERYHIRLSVYNNETGKNDMYFDRISISENQLNKDSIIIGKKIRDFYLKKYKTVEIKTPEKDNSKFIEIESVSVMPGLYYPLGSLSDTIKSGYGVNLELREVFPPARKIILIQKIGAYNLEHNPDAAIESAQMYLLGIDFGYSFNFKKFSVIPQIGIGYMIHSIDGMSENASEYDRELYRNPYADTGFTFEYSFSNTLKLAVKPVYTMFFEPDSMLHLGLLNFGITWSF